jgi:pyruvate,water dikinase
MRRAAAIVTDHGGRTSHAAIVSRELGLPAVVGTGNGTERLDEDREVTVSCAEGETGRVYAGVADSVAKDIDLADIPQTRTRIMLNLASPAAALVRAGIDSISVNPDSFLAVKRSVAEAERSGRAGARRWQRALRAVTETAPIHDHTGDSL